MAEGLRWPSVSRALGLRIQVGSLCTLLGLHLGLFRVWGCLGLGMCNFI